MRVSILQMGKAPCGRIGERTFYHLSLDRSVAYFCHDEQKRKRFLRILSEPLLSADDIVCRQDVLRDFVRQNGLLVELSGLLSRFGALCRAHGEEHHAIRKAFTDSVHAHPDTLRNLLQASALTLKRALLFLRAIAELLGKHPIKSALLHALREAASGFLSAPAEELLRLCARLEHFGSGRLDVRVELDGSGRIGALRLIEPIALASDGASSKRGLFGFKRREDSQDIALHFPPGDDNEQKIGSYPLLDTAFLLDSLTAELTKKFSGICDEIGFYETAMEYHAMLLQSANATCFPRIEATPVFSCDGLQDLYLLCTARRDAPVVPYSIPASRKTDAIAVFGANGSGKTVFLRTLGTAQILAQAGLPLPAEAVTIGIRTSVLTQFSEAEKEFEAGNDAGRFEQEVRELAVMVENIAKGSLVLLNETFQTTAYREGAQGLLPILQWFSEQGIGYALVSHLRDLELPLMRENVTVMHTRENFRIEPDHNQE